VYRDILQVAERDYEYVLRTIALQEIATQSRMGNKPTAMLVDGRAGKPIEQATRSVRAWFADRGTLADAIIAARDELVLNGRRDTGHTLDGLRFYYSVGKYSKRLTLASDIRTLVANFKNPRALDLYVSLPLPHVRKWQWLGRTGDRLKRKSRDKKRGFNPVVGGARMVSRSVFELCATRTQRRFPSMDVRDIYVEVQNLNVGGKVIVDRIPAIRVCMKIRGRLTNG